jgi:sulfatase maturation enzyme AslB (radical SAM superfamily)
MRPCCMALESPEMVNRDADGQPIKAYSRTEFESAWNSAFMRTLRVAMLSGERPSICRRCFRDEDLGIRSHREMSNEMFAEDTTEVLQSTGGDGSADTRLIRSIDIRLGNRCNLKCRMCSPVSSRATLDDYAALHGIEPDHPELVELIGRKDWVSDPAFKRLFEASSTGARRLHFSGGEPLLVPEMGMFLEGLIDRGLAPGIELHYVTNLTVLPERLFTLWTHFRKVGFVISLDGIGTKGEYVRHPMRWSRLQKNLISLDERSASIRCDSLHVNVTVQAYNVLNVDETVEWVADHLPNHGRPKLSLLYYPEHLGVCVLPPQLKTTATERLTRLSDRLAGGWPEQWRGRQADDLRRTIDGIVAHMIGSDKTNLLDEFRRWTLVLDERRSEDVRTSLPELASIFDLDGAALRRIVRGPGR